MNFVSLRRLLTTSAFALGASASVANAQSTTPHSWKWPLYKRVDNTDGTVSTGQPRPAIRNQNGELQAYDKSKGASAPANNYLHNGNDIRGDAGDPVAAPVDSTLVGAFQYNTDCTMGGTSTGHCRAWFETTDKNFLYYTGHLDLSTTTTTTNRPISNDLRASIQTFMEQFGNPTPDLGTNLNSTVQVPKGTIIAPLYPFAIGGGAFWTHLHLGIYDRHHNYDLYDTNLLLEQNPVGQTGAQLSRALVDDTPPTVHQLAFLQSGSTTDLRTSGTCGPEISGAATPITIEAQIDDEFFPDRSGSDYATFPGKGVLSDTTGIRAVRTTIVNVATGATLVGPILWEDLSPWTEQVCSSALAQSTAGCFPPLTTMDDSTFFKFLTPDNGASGAGEDILYSLFDLTRSASTYSVAGGEVYWHNVTSSATELANFTVSPSSQPWTVSTLANGLYQVSVEAQDFYGNRGARTEFVVVHQPGTSLNPSTSNGLSHAYIKDNASDSGAVPSSLGGQPFWESPDIFIVPHGDPVDMNATSSETLVTAGATFDVYLKLHNDSACAPVNNVKASVYVADPAALSQSWSSITNGQYLTDTNNPSSFPSGVNISAQGSALLGPFVWPVPATYTGDGHKCILANIQADGEPAPGKTFDAPGSNQVGQRNIQLSHCAYPLTNGTTQSGQLQLTINVSPGGAIPTLAAGSPDIELSFSDPGASWYNVWHAQPEQGASFSVTNNGAGVTTMRLGSSMPKLNPVALGAGESRSVSMAMTLPNGSPTTDLNLTAAFTGAGGATILNGGSCVSTSAPATPPPPPLE